MATMKSILLALAGIFTLACFVVAAPAPADETPDVDQVQNWTNIPGGNCQTSVAAPSYYCFVTLDNGNALIFYASVSADGTFQNGAIREVDRFTQMDVFNSVNWSGTNLSGDFSGVRPDGTAFHGSATEVIGRCKRGGYKGSVHYVPCVVSGLGTVTSED